MTTMFFGSMIAIAHVRSVVLRGDCGIARALHSGQNGPLILKPYQGNVPDKTGWQYSGVNADSAVQPEGYGSVGISCVFPCKRGI